MSYTYKLEGSNGGYPLEEDPRFETWFDEIRSTHTCAICGEEGHEDDFYRTNLGWCCISCYDYLHSECSNEPNLPQII